MNKPLNIRKARLEDLPAIVDIYNLSIPGRRATADTEIVSVESKVEWFHSHHDLRPLYVLEINNTVAGYLSFKSFYGRPAYSITAEIGIYIHPDFQGKGIGKILLQKAIEVAPEIKLENLLGYIFAHNEPSISLFKKFGFEEWGRFKGVGKMDNKYVDLIIFGRKT